VEERSVNPALTPAKGPPGLRLLLVEDHEDTLRIMARLFREFGYVVHTARGVAQAVELIDREKPHLFVSDMGLPDGSGLDIMRHVKSSRLGVQGIVVSGFGGAEDIERSRQAGFAHHLIKPVPIEKLKAACDQAIAQAS
jgi:CheY-like chemotaxis protein